MNKTIIYLEDAIEALGEEPEVWEDDDEYGMGQRSEWCHIKKIIEKLPSAQPEIVRCEECKHYKEWESEFTPNAVVTQCMADNFPISKAIPDGWFCAGAERKRK